MMCKRIWNVIQNLHKQCFERKASAILNDDVSEAIFNQICYVLPSLYDKSIFRATSFECLGKLYFDNLHTSQGQNLIIKIRIISMRNGRYIFHQVS